MEQNINLFSKTKEILENDLPQRYNSKKYQEQKDNYPNNEINLNNYKNNNDNNYHFNYNAPSFDNKFILQKNNEKLMNLNKSIKEDKEKLLNILSPIKPEIQENEEIYEKPEINNQQEYQIFYPTINYLNNIKSLYNYNTIELQNDIMNIKNKKNKLVLVYNSLYNFKQKSLKKEKEIKEKENKINKYENMIKTNESILKNNLESFNNYINYQTQSLINKFKNIKNYHEQKEGNLKLREEKINEYEMIISNIIQRKEMENKVKLMRCINIGDEIEKKLGIEMEKIKQKEKEEQIIKDYKNIEKEKNKIEKEKELIQREREKLLLEKKQNKKIKKRNEKHTKLFKQHKNFFNKHNNNNSSTRNIKQKQNYSNIIDFVDFNLFRTPLKDEFNSENNNNSNSNIFDQFNRPSSNSNSNRDIIKKAMTPMVYYHPIKYTLSNPYRNRNLYNKDDSLFSHHNISNNISNNIKFNSMNIGNEEIEPIKKNSHTYIHDNIYLIKSRRNNLYNNMNNINNTCKRPNSSRSAFKTEMAILRNKRNNFTNRTINLVNNFDDNNKISKYSNESIINDNSKNNAENENENENKSKFLEIKSNNNKEEYDDINKQIFEAEKALQLMKSQESKIQSIQEKLDKKVKEFS